MSIKDKEKWNKKYESTPKLLEQREPSEKLKFSLSFVKGDDALDIACGAGKNSIYLAKKAFQIDSLDISEFAINSLKEKNIKNINAKVVDLEGYNLDENKYDFIVQTNYLDRELIPKLIKALKKDGILFIETYMHHEINEKPSSNPNFLLKKDELKSFFNKEFEIIDYDEFDNDDDELYKMKKQSIIVKKLS